LFIRDRASTDVNTRSIVGSVRCVEETGAASLEEDLNVLLGGDGYASVAYASSWRITVTDTHTIFESATDSTLTEDFVQQ